MSQTSITSASLASNAARSVSDPHALSADDVLNTLGSHQDGLSSAEAANPAQNRWPKPASGPAERRAVEAVFQALQ